LPSLPNGELLGSGRELFVTSPVIALKLLDMVTRERLSQRFAREGRTACSHLLRNLIDRFD
jgi:hypothetical protein